MTTVDDIDGMIRMHEREHERLALQVKKSRSRSVRTVLLREQEEQRKAIIFLKEKRGDYPKSPEAA